MVIIERGLLWFNWNGIGSHFRILQNLVLLQDDVQEERVFMIMGMLINVFVSQSEFWKTKDFCIEHLIRICSISPIAPRIHRISFS
jgi:hypothetical protein